MHEVHPSVLFVDYGMAFGGAVVSMAELIEHLPADVNVVVLSAQDPAIVRRLAPRATHVRLRMPINYVQRERFLRKIDASSVGRALRYPLLKCYALLDSIAEHAYAAVIASVARRHRVNLLHLNNHLDLTGIRAARAAGIPLVAHYRGLAPVEPRVLANRHTATTVTKVIAISTAVADAVRRSGFPAEKVQVIHNPVHLAAYSAAASRRAEIRKSFSFSDEDVVFGVFGRVTEWKGQLELLQAIARISTVCPNLRVLVVGDASDDVHGYMGRVRALAARPELTGRVEFAGYQRDVAAYYWASDAVVHCSTLPEPFGRVVIEAMACSRPVIAMAEGGPLDIVTDQHDGLLVTPRDVDALASAVRKLYDDGSLRERLGSAAVATARARFAADAIARQVVALYQAVLSDAPRLAWQQEA